MENLIPSLAELEDIEVVGVCDSSSAALARARRWFPEANSSHDYREIVKDLDAIVVAATPQVHEEVASTALSMGIPVFVEKPPTVTASGIKSLAKLAAENKIVTGVGHNLRFAAASDEMRKMIHMGFGRPVAMEMRYMASKPRGDRWNLGSPLRSFLLSHANHALDLMVCQMGPISQIAAARAWPERNGGIALVSQFVFNSGAVGNLMASSYAPHFSVAATILSEQGRIIEMRGLHSVIADGYDSKRWARQWTPRTLDSGFENSGYKTELRAFFDAVANKQPEAFQPSFADEIAIYEVIDRIEVLLQGQG